jgi:Uncharacterized protein conserved in bacteria
MSKQQNFLEELSDKKPESYQEEVFVAAHFNPGRLIVPIIILLFGVAAFLVIVHLGDVTVPDLSDWQLNDIQTWVSKHHDNTLLKGVYSREKEVNCVISQDIKAGTKISRNKTLTVTYSLGADPEEYIKIPDLMKMSSSEIKKWIEDNQLTQATVKSEESDVVPKDTVINYELRDGTEKEYQRKNRLIIYLSSGSASLNETFQMPDLSGKTKTDVQQWAKQQQITIKYKEVFNQDVAYGKVFAQNIEKNTKITRKDTIEVSLSRGKEITVPDFTGMTRSEAQELATLLGISAFFKLIVSKEEPDTVLNQDIAAKTIIDQKQYLTFEVAKKEGKIIVPNFIGLTSSEVNSLAALYGMKVFIKNAEKTGSSGIVAVQSEVPGKIVQDDTIVRLQLKENDAVTVPDFIGLSQNKATQLAKNLGIELIFNEKEAMNAENKTVISQDTKAKRKLKTGGTILLSIAINSGIKAENLEDMSLEEAKAWAIQLGITLNVVDSYSDTRKSGKLYDQDCDSGKWIPSNKVLTVYHSLGLVFVPNLIGKTKTDIKSWLDEINSKGAGVRAVYTDDLDTAKSKGTVTSQSVSENLVPLDEKIIFGVSSSDNGLLIKNFEGSNAEDFKLWCKDHSIPYIMKECYSDTLEKDVLYGQNYKDTYLPENTNLRISCSLGKVYVKDFTGCQKSEMTNWQKEVNDKNANIELMFLYEPSMTYAKGSVIYQNIMNQEVSLKTTIMVTLSSGM